MVFRDVEIRVKLYTKGQDRKQNGTGERKTDRNTRSVRMTMRAAAVDRPTQKGSITVGTVRYGVYSRLSVPSCS